MGNVLKKLRYLRRLTHRLPAEEQVQRLRQLLLPLRPMASSDAASHIVVQCVQDPFYLTLFAHLAHALRQRAPLEAELLVCQSFNAAIGIGWKPWVMRAFPLNRLQVDQWIRLWDVVATRVAYRSSSLNYPLGDLIDAWRSWRLWRGLGSADELEAVTIEGVICGDLVIDSYLRFRPSPRVEVGDLFMLRVLWQAHRDIRRAKNYFSSTRPLLYLTSYTTYVQHGIAARVALQEGVRVFSFGNFQEFGKLLSKGDSFHTRNALNYQRDFDQLPEPALLMQEATRQLEARLAGGIDIATSYMVSSAYRKTTSEVPDVRSAVVVFLHDFYDSPHVYADLVFPDFWEWICFTLDTLISAGIRFMVKPHPNQIALNDTVINELLGRFPGLEMVAPEVTNRQLTDAGMACAVTVYGTVAHEMAYMGVPTIACARHPHVAFNFCRTARTRASYADLLREALTQVCDRESLREQALRFFVMHNLSLPPAQLALRDAFISTWKMFNDTLSDVSELSRSFVALAELPGYAIFIDEMLNGLELTAQVCFTTKPGDVS